MFAFYSLNDRHCLFSCLCFLFLVVYFPPKPKCLGAKCQTVPFLQRKEIEKRNPNKKSKQEIEKRNRKNKEKKEIKKRNQKNKKKSKNTCFFRF